MRGLLKKGWDMAVRHKYVVVLLFLYRLLWGFFLYRFVDSVVTPILARYPAAHPNSDAAHLFLVEAQFRLLKTDMVNETLWLLGGLLLMRMALTPLINAGVFYSFYHATEDEGTRVLSGMKRVWKPVTLLYWLENGLALLPAAWLLPLARDRFYSEPSLTSWFQGLLPYALAWLAFGFLLHLVFQFMQFGAASREGIFKGLGLALGRALPLLGITFILLGVGLAVSATAWAVSMLWSGFLAVMLHQAFYFVRSLLTLWTSASQYQVWCGTER
ncbi:hypothetical protein D7Z26_22850 [Cohnella endophytica]|uniref:DUF975 family protein n=1 Tax=Cohnella endophytica TaxID=2419778 RepID=A0A494XIT4_9BACL|nr:hypothetical protein [Cohnella endophytica]RKP48039.1 hypothetical protein D7Z26_22850 [Cohnella endophytica]